MIINFALFDTIKKSMTHMKRIPTSILIITAFLITYVVLIVAIDPFNYFNTGVINQDVKDRIFYKINDRLAAVIAYNKNPSPNLLIGDSRIKGLNCDVIKEVTHETYFNFGYGAATIPEVVDNFWFATKRQRLKNVYFGISLSMYNKYNNKNLFNNAVRSSSLFYYIFNSTNLEVIFYLVKDFFSKEKISLGVPKMDKDKFWLELINSNSNKFYNLYKYPDEFYRKLKEIKVYCADNDINLVFFIPPEYIDQQNKIREYSLLKENQRFKDDIKSLGRVYDFNVDSEFTKNKDNFSDPFHIKRELNPLIINIIFKDTTSDKDHSDIVISK